MMKQATMSGKCRLARLLPGFLAAVLLLQACAAGAGKEPGTAAESNTETGAAGEPGTAWDLNLGGYLSEVYQLNGRNDSCTVSDSLVIGDSASEQSHSLVLQGAVRETQTAATGTRSDEYDVLSFSREGDSAEWVMDLSAPTPKNATEPLMLEIQEIHQASEQGFAYSVLADGQEVYFRTYEQIASAPNHYFIRIDRNAVEDLSRVRITIRSACNTGFSVSRVWGYSDFSTLTEEQEIYTDMGLNLYGANNVQTAAEKLAPFLEQEYTLFDLGVTFRLDYMNLTVEKALEQMVTYMSAAEGWKINLQIMPAMYWSSSPYATDGLGGNFSDSKYSQVLYNSVTGEYYDTTPNVYSSTNWVTTGNDVLNAAAVTKLETIFSQFSQTYALQSAGKTALPAIDYVMEWGVCYKGMGTMTGVSSYGALDGGDWNAALIAKAEADGVTLSPEDGLSYTEKLWLTNWHAKYNQMLANAYHSGMGTDAVLVNNGTVTLPTTQQTDHLFSHNVQWMNQNPSHDLTISGWMSGIGTGFYSSSEDMYFDDVRYYQYKTAYGRTGCVNLEMAIHNPSDIFYDYIRQSYEQGLEFVTVYNDKEEYGTAETLKQLDLIANANATKPTEYRVNVVNLDFCRDAAVQNLLGTSAEIRSVTGLTHNTGDGKLEMTDSSASLLLYASDAGRAFANGLTLDLQATIGKIGDKISIWVGDSPDSLTLAGNFDWSGTEAVDRFNSNHFQSFDLTGLTKGKSGAYIRIDLTSSGKTASLQSAKVYLNNGTATGQQNGLSPTVRERRTENLWISRRAVALRMLESYLEKSGGENAVSEAARELIEKGCVTTAYEMLSGMISQLLPATYILTGSGTLGCYPVSMTSSRKSLPVTVLLSQYGSDGIVFRATAERALTLDVTFTALPAGSRWLAVEGEDGLFSLLPAGAEDADARTVNADGTLSVQVTAKIPDTTRRYTEVSGRCYADVTSSGIQVAVQDPEISEYSEYVSFTFASACTFTRRADGSETVVSGSAAKPKAGDYVILTFNDAGTEVISCEAVYGEKTGVIASVVAPDPQQGINGSITLTDGTTYELEYNKFTTKISVGSVNSTARALHAYEIANALRVGMQVTVTYCPERYQGAPARLLTVTG